MITTPEQLELWPLMPSGRCPRCHERRPKLAACALCALRRARLFSSVSSPARPDGRRALIAQLALGLKVARDRARQVAEEARAADAAAIAHAKASARPGEPWCCEGCRYPRPVTHVRVGQRAAFLCGSPACRRLLRSSRTFSATVRENQRLALREQHEPAALERELAVKAEMRSRRMERAHERERERADRLERKRALEAKRAAEAEAKRERKLKRELARAEARKRGDALDRDAMIRYASEQRAGLRSSIATHCGGYVACAGVFYTSAEYAALESRSLGGYTSAGVGTL